MKKLSSSLTALIISFGVLVFQLVAPFSASPIFAASGTSSSTAPSYSSAASSSSVDKNCTAPSSGPQPIAQNCIIVDYVKPAINFLSAGVGVVVVAVVILGAIQYTASAGNPQAVAAARKRIINAILALVVYALAYSFLNFIIPGGLIAI